MILYKKPNILSRLFCNGKAKARQKVQKGTKSHENLRKNTQKNLSHLFLRNVQLKN